MLTKRRYTFDRYDVGALVVIAIAASIRIILISLGWPATNSDEATMGLMARHIAYLGEHPIFMYGQNYMGSLESHIGAALFLLFGPSLFALRLGLVLLDVFFFFVMYRLTRLLYTRGMALFVVLLLCFGSTETMLRQLKVLGGAVETMLFGSLLLLIATWLALAYRDAHQSSISNDFRRGHNLLRPRASLLGMCIPVKRFQRGSEGVINYGPYENRRSSSNNTPRMSFRRLSLYACFGIVMGLGMWSHMLVLPFVGASLLLLLLICRREMRTRVWLCLIGGFLLGFSPTLLFDIEHPLQNALGTLWQVQSSGGLATTLPYTFWDRIRGTVLISLPMATGFNPACNLSADPGVWRSQISSCVLTQGIWGVGYLIIMGLAVVFAAHELRRCYRIYRKSQGDDERRTLVYAVARAMLLVCGGLTLLAFFFSPASALVPITSARYLVGLTVMLPALIAPFWATISGVVKYRQDRARITRPLWQQRGLALASSIVLLLVVVNYAISLVAVFQQVPSVQAVNQQQDAMVNDLLRAHITRIYSDYWTCNRVIFQSGERILCSVLDNQLQTGQNRYAPYSEIVQSDPNASYVFAVGSPQATSMSRRASQAGTKYHVVQMDGYVVYEPVSRAINHPVTRLG